MTTLNGGQADNLIKIERSYSVTGKHSLHIANLNDNLHGTIES